MSEARNQRFEIDIDEIERQLRQSADLAPAAKADPLAELARIVGQNDPFRGILGERKSADPQAAERAANVHILARPGFAPEPRLPAPESAYQQPAYQEAVHEADPRDAGYDPVANAYGSTEEAYAEDDMQPLRPRRSRGKLAAVLGLLLVTSAAVGGGLYWRKVGGRLDATGAPPVITADKSPLKVAPADPGGLEVPNQNKQIYDRKAPDGQSRVVDTREQPVDVREVARTLPSTTPVVPPAPAPRIASNDPARPAAAPDPAPRNPVSSVLGEPRRVRTVAVRPDGSVYAPPGQPMASDASPSLMPGSPPPAVPVATVSVPVRPAPETPPVQVPMAMAMPDSTPSVPANGAIDAPPAEEMGPAVRVLPPRRPKFEVAALTQPDAKPSEPKPTEAKAEESKREFTVQVAVRESDGDARTAWNGLMEKYPGDLEGRRAQVNKAEVGGKTVYRVRVGPLSKTDANALCGKLKSSGGSCFVASAGK